ncbi:MAG TPA: YciI family protein [Streptosporangiaceae bacterium]
MRFLGYTLGDPSTPMTQPGPEDYAEMNKFVEEATKAGVLLATGGVGPIEGLTKIVNTGGKITVVDGPFTEAKELIGGWALMECRDHAEAIEWSKRFMALAGEGEVRLREVFMP